MGGGRFVRFLAGRCEAVFLTVRPDGGGRLVRCEAVATHRPADGSWLCDACQAEQDRRDAVAAAGRKPAAG